MQIAREEKVVSMLWILYIHLEAKPHKCACDDSQVMGSVTMEEWW